MGDMDGNGTPDVVVGYEAVDALLWRRMDRLCERPIHLARLCSNTGYAMK
jgi:hypothetical protein